MQFVTNGPDIPEELLQAHEDGRVVFFCGAGISYSANLPGFRGLVDDIYSNLGTGMEPAEKDAYNRHQFDGTLDLLERRIPGQRLAVRTALMNSLSPNLKRKNATVPHKSLLQLGRDRKGSLRLVTTNFDRIFESVGKNTKQPFNAYSAPMFPIPKNSRWNGLVYLHGLLPLKPDEASLNRLVFTSGDFGLAYLIERWAARFVSELFRNYVVCFVGYSINDPVLRYMMDALAADRMLGETTPQAYALGGCELGKESTIFTEWEAKGVSPILYEVPKGTENHDLLFQTLKVWAETYTNGTLGKERIVVDHAMARPIASTKQDDFVGRMLWALSHKSGLPAKRFAELSPVPPLEWLEAFTESRFGHRDLLRFGVPSVAEEDGKLSFNLIKRPSPYILAPWMSLVSGAMTSSKLDPVMFQLARWLVRHLNDPSLIHWISKHGNQLHEHFSLLIEDSLNTIYELEKDGKTEELERIRADAPNAIPDTFLRTIWRFLLSNRVKSPWRDMDLYAWKRKVKQEGLNTSLRMELREILSPKIELKKPFRWGDLEGEEGDKRPVDWELVLSTDHILSSVQDIRLNGDLNTILIELVDDFEVLLQDALNLLKELGVGDEKHGRTYWDIPSIEPHWQNKGFKEWVVLIELLRDSWLLVYQSDPARASNKAKKWFSIPDPCFKRLALFAASKEGSVEPDVWVDWLLSDENWWLWSNDLHRELMRLFVLQGHNLSLETREKLEKSILLGPPREKYKSDLEDDDWQNIVDRSIWLRLAKLHKSTGELGKASLKRFEELSLKNPKWKTNERDEFLSWMSGTGDPDYEERREIDLAPRKRSELVSWLKQPPPKNKFFYEDTWRTTCRERFFHTSFALCDIAEADLWPVGRWKEALQVWSEDGKVLRSWKFMAPRIQTMPDDTFLDVIHSLAWWIEVVSKSVEKHETIFFDICQRVLQSSSKGGMDSGELVANAMNHPVGHVTQALLNLWFRREPNDNDKLSEDIEPFFTQLCDIQNQDFRHGRVMLASRAIALFRVDKEWTVNYLLPLYDWERNVIEAKAVWEGFLWSPRLYFPLMAALKVQFLGTASHYAELGSHGRQYASLVTYAALDLLDGYSYEDFRTAISALPQEGLDESAQALVQALEGAGDQREAYWKSRIQPFWQNVWPKSLKFVSNNIAESLVRLSIAAGNEFPSALFVVRDWLQPIEYPHYVIHKLLESNQPVRFPQETLSVLDAIVPAQGWPDKDLGECLEIIAQADSSLVQDPRYQRLQEYFRKRGG